MIDLFPAAVEIILESEGVLSDDAADPGGLTKYGISKAAHPNVEIASLTRDKAIQIYRTEYWDTHRCGDMPWPWALTLFDGVVNQGDTIVRLMQRAIGAIEDGNIGPQTLAAIPRYPGSDQFDQFLANRAMLYGKSANFLRFGRGWMVRLFRVARQAQNPPA